MRIVFSAVAAITVALLGPPLLSVFSAIGRQKATGIAALLAGLLEALHSPLFWILAVSFFGLFFAASRLSSRVLRIVLFWTPTLLFSTLGVGLSAFCTYIWMHFRRS
jgi:hypothetical protein